MKESVKPTAIHSCGIEFLSVVRANEAITARTLGYHQDALCLSLTCPDLDVRLYEESSPTTNITLLGLPHGAFE